MGHLRLELYLAVRNALGHRRSRLMRRKLGNIHAHSEPERSRDRQNTLGHGRVPGDGDGASAHEYVHTDYLCGRQQYLGSAQGRVSWSTADVYVWHVYTAALYAVDEYVLLFFFSLFN